MTSRRLTAHAPRTHALANDIAQLPGTCLGCEGCTGLCAALIDAMLLPEMIVKGRST